MNIAELGPGVWVWHLFAGAAIFAALPLIVSSIDKLEREEVVKCGFGIMVIIAVIASYPPVEKILNERVDSAFSRTLYEQYDASSSKPYTEIRKELEEDEESEVSFERNQVVTDVRVIERDGELMFIGDEGMYLEKDED
jgi:hypothetical protein